MARYATTETLIECPCEAHLRFEELEQTILEGTHSDVAHEKCWEVRYNCPGCKTLLIIDYADRKKIDPRSTVAAQDRGRYG